MTQALIEAAAELIERGLPILAVGGRDGKNPGINGDDWQKRSYSVDDIATALRGQRKPGIGVILGPKSGVIDIEADSPEQEAAVAELFAGCDVPVTPTYQSKRGKHRLFKWDDTLHNAGKATVDFCGSNGAKLGIRIGANGKAEQSVIPPSPGRTWLVSPDESDFAELPELVIDRIVAAANDGSANGTSKRDWSKVVQGVNYGERNETCAAYAGRQLELIGGVSDDRKVAAALENVLLWNRQNNPPLSGDEVRRTFDSILRRAQSQCATGGGVPSGGSLREALAAAIGDPSLSHWYDMELTKHKSDPVRWSLKTVNFAKAEGSRIELKTTDDLTSKTRANKIAVNDADTPFPDGILRKWKAIYTVLLQYVKVVEVDPDERRDVLIASILLDVLENAKLSKNDEPHPKGEPTKMSDASVWAQMQGIYEAVEMRFPRLKYEPAEFVRCANNAAGAKRRNKRAGCYVQTFKRFGMDGLQALRLKTGRVEV